MGVEPVLRDKPQWSAAFIAVRMDGEKTKDYAYFGYSFHISSLPSKQVYPLNLMPVTPYGITKNP